MDSCELRKLLACEDYNAILQALPSQNDAVINPEDVQVYLVSLVKCNEFERAVEFYASQSKASQGSLADDCNFARCYALYRLQRFTEALECLEGGKSSLKSLLLKAQALFRMERYEECLAAFEQCKKSFPELSKDPELFTNILAAKALGEAAKGFDEKALIKEGESLGSFEALTNVAFLLGSVSRWVEAEKIYLRALVACEKAGLSQEEVEVEKNLIRLQLAFVYCNMKGQKEKALTLLKEIPMPSDSASQIVWKNNLKFASGSSLCFAEESTLAKTNSIQREKLLRNICHAKKTRFFLRKYIELFPSSEYCGAFERMLKDKEVKENKDSVMVNVIPQNASELDPSMLQRILAAPGKKRRASHSRNPKPKKQTLRIDPERWIAKRNRSTRKGRK